MSTNISHDQALEMSQVHNSSLTSFGVGGEQNVETVEGQDVGSFDGMGSNDGGSVVGSKSNVHVGSDPPSPSSTLRRLPKRQRQRQQRRSATRTSTKIQQNGAFQTINPAITSLQQKSTTTVITTTTTTTNISLRHHHLLCTRQPALRAGQGACRHGRGRVSPNPTALTQLWGNFVAHPQTRPSSVTWE